MSTVTRFEAGNVVTLGNRCRQEQKELQEWQGVEISKYGDLSLQVWGLVLISLQQK